MPDIEDQADELLALASIYSEEALVLDPPVDEHGGNSSGKFHATVDLPSPTYLKLQDSVEQFVIKHLPPLTLCFTLPPDYPSSSPPIYTLSCSWLCDVQLKTLSTELVRLWEENSGMVILFTWTSFLQTQTFEILRLGNTLTVSQDLLQVLQAYNSQKLAEEFAGTLFSCEVCFRDRPGSASLCFEGCEHVYCRDCMREYFSTQISDGSVKRLVCPRDGCESVATTQQVKELVSKEMFDRYDQLLLQLSLDTMADHVYCPRKDCSYPAQVDAKAGMGRCPSCQYVFCTTCSKTYHHPSPCAVPRSLAELSEREEEEEKAMKSFSRRLVRELKQSMMSLEWMGKHSKKCPHCCAQIQKIDGCNKMACSKCSTYFCWLCRQVLSRLSPYDHFREMGTPCYDKLHLPDEQGGANAPANADWSSDSEEDF